MVGSRPGGVGLADLWVGMPVNSPFCGTLGHVVARWKNAVFTSARPGGLGLPEMWMSTRGAGAGGGGK